MRYILRSEYKEKGRDASPAGRVHRLGALLAALVFLSLAAWGCGSGNDAGVRVRTGAPAPDASESSGAVELTEASFDSVTGRGVVLVDFWSERCPPCRRQGPVVDRLARRFEGRCVVGKLDVEAHGSVARRFSLRYIPTLIVLRDGRPVKRFTGFQEESVLAGALEEALEDARSGGR